MQFGLVGSQAGHIEHQSANLQQAAQIVIQTKGVDQDVNGRAVFAPQRRLEIAQVAILFHRLRVLLSLLERKIQLRGNVDLQ